MPHTQAEYDEALAEFHAKVESVLVYIGELDTPVLLGETKCLVSNLEEHTKHLEGGMGPGTLMVAAVASVFSRFTTNVQDGTATDKGYLPKLPIAVEATECRCHDEDTVGLMGRLTEVVQAHDKAAHIAWALQQNKRPPFGDPNAN